MGTTIETGTRSNLQKDVRLSAPAAEMIDKARDLVRRELGEVQRLGPDGRFRAYPVLPEFAWFEAIVNAVTHRSYSMQGDGIRIRDFADRLEVQSPGQLPGRVRPRTIRDNRQSRNPHFARALAESTGYVRELNEGVPRMFREMARVGLPEPRYTMNETSVTVILSKIPRETPERDSVMDLGIPAPEVEPANIEETFRQFRRLRKLRTSDVARLWGRSVPTTRKYLRMWSGRGSFATSPGRRAIWSLTGLPPRV